MPIQVYECPKHGKTEKIFLSASSVTKTIRCKAEGCSRRIRRIIGRTRFKMKYGLAYAYATDSDRRAWLKRNDLQGWSTDQQTQYERGGGRPKVRDTIH
jgi:predicted nucleic acid-binding Zn ribbon protein